MQKWVILDEEYFVERVLPIVNHLLCLRLKFDGI